MKEVKGTVGIPKEYFFTMGTRDYTSYESALPREFYQNSIDAGASQITVEFDDEEKTITITDDGCGMDRDIILNKLLVLGGSHKSEGSVGAFGKAKEILYFAWIKYCIRSNYCVVNGENDKFTLTSGEFFTGTKVI